MRRQVVQWRGDNAAEAERLLAQHLARADKHGDKLHLVGIGLNVELSLGDSLVMEGDRLGIQRAVTTAPLTEEFVTWTGENMGSVISFMRAYQVRIEVVDGKIRLYGDDSYLPWFTLRKGDRLIKRDGQIIVSLAGRDHRH